MIVKRSTKIKTKKVVFACLLAATVTLGACGSDSELENKRWRIVELGGVAVTEEDNYVIFDSAEGRVQTSLGCNNISLPYKIVNGLQIKIEDGTTTLMACLENKREAELIKALLEVDNVSISGTTMTLNRARMAPLVRLELSTQENTTGTAVPNTTGAPVFDGAPAL